MIPHVHVLEHSLLCPYFVAVVAHNGLELTVHVSHHHYAKFNDEVVSVPCLLVECDQPKDVLMIPPNVYCSLQHQFLHSIH